MSATLTRDPQQMRLPVAQCDVCGADIKWVRESRTGRTLAINAEPSQCGDGKALYARVPAKYAHGRIDCVWIPVGADDRCGERYLYVPHQSTCPRDSLWTRYDPPLK